MCRPGRSKPLFSKWRQREHSKPTGQKAAVLRIPESDAWVESAIEWWSGRRLRQPTVNQAKAVRSANVPRKDHNGKAWMMAERPNDHSFQAV